MALISYTKGEDGPDFQVYTWSGASNGGTPDTFEPVRIPRNPYTITTQASGTFGASASVAMHGSVDGVTYVALGDLTGTAIAFTADGVASMRDGVLYLKPVLTGGDGSTDIVASILLRFDSK